MFVIIVHSINLQPNIIHVSSNSSVFVCRVAGNYVLLPKTSIHMSIRVKHERADSSAEPKDLKVTTKFIYATPTDVYNVRRNGLRKIQEKKGSRHSCHSANTRDPSDSHSVNQRSKQGRVKEDLRTKKNTGLNLRGDWWRQTHEKQQWAGATPMRVAHPSSDEKPPS